jgi:serine/threonine protein kinase/tetratricopeptide (TPR) repeat protein
MLCPNCGTDTPFPATVCRTCSTPFPGNFVPSPDAETIAFQTGTGPSRDPGAEGRAGPLAVGEPFGARYRILRELGAGGMGVVYQAWDEDLGVPVALKVIRTEVGADPNLTRDIERRFKRELLLARQVTHHNVVRIYDLGDINGIKYITMSYVEGVDLATLIQREGKLAVPRALRMVRGVVSGLRAAHAAGVVHRDLKPANIMIDEQDEARIMDFGIARSTSLPPEAQAAPGEGPKPIDLSQNAAMITATMQGGVVGTVEYMAPEQARGEEVDQRADLYALGLIMYDMLGGAGRAARSNSALGELTARMQEPPPGIRSINPDVPEPLARLIARCLEPDAKARYASTKDLETDLHRLDDQGNLLPVLRRVSTRQIVAAVILTAILLTGTWWVSRTPVAPPAPTPVSVLVTDFENSTGDPVFEGALEQALAIAMEGSPFITVYPQKAARALAAELKPASKGRLDLQTAPLIAGREGVKVILAGSIARRGSSGFRLSVRVIDPTDGNQTGRIDRDVASKADVLQAVAALSERVRRDLGESKKEMGKVAAAETFTAGSIEAMRAYARGQEQLNAGNYQPALQAFQEAVRFDPKLGRAYSAMGAIYVNLKQTERAEGAFKDAMNHLDRMSEREKYRTFATYYVGVVGNYDKAIENYEQLIKAFPADNNAYGNLALAYVHVGNIKRAREVARKGLDIYPDNVLQRTNYAAYSVYAGDFDTAAKEAERVLAKNPAYEFAYLPLALARVGQADLPAARAAYAKLAEISDTGRSLAALGSADVDVYEGRLAEAAATLRAAVPLNEKLGSSGELGAKHLVLGEIALALGERGAVTPLVIATAETNLVNVLVPAAHAAIEGGADAIARKVAVDLQKRLQNQTTAYAGVIEAELALKAKDYARAIDLLKAALARQDLWMARFALGRAYFEAGAGHEAEALDEWEKCLARRGEAMDLFFADSPTTRYLPQLYYWLGRARQGAGAPSAAATAYRDYLAIRGKAPRDPLAADAQRRLVTLK